MDIQTRTLLTDHAEGGVDVLVDVARADLLVEADGDLVLRVEEHGHTPVDGVV